MKQHPNSGATIWATIPQKNCLPNTVLTLSTFPAGQRVFAIATGETCDPGSAVRALSALDVALSADGVPFRAAHVERWFLREMPGQGSLIGNKPWDRHPAYSGPMDSFIYVFDPKASDERAAAEASAPPPPEPAPIVVTEQALETAVETSVEEPASVIEAPEPVSRPRTRRVPTPQGASAAAAPKTTTIKKTGKTAAVTPTTSRSRVNPPRKKS